MNCENKLQDPETGTVLRKPGSQRSCFWQSLFAIAVLGLLTVSAYLLLCQLRVLPSTQEMLPNPEQHTKDQSALTAPTNTAPAFHRLRRQVGGDPRRRIGAHLTASSTSRGDNVMWQNDADPTFSEGVEFRDNCLVIKTPGQYFVYSQVVFHSKGCEGQTVYLNHELAKFSSSYPEEALLLRATKSVCHYGKHGDPWYKTSYQGAIFEFDEGDRVFSRVSKEVVGYLDTTQGKTFFGIFAV